MRKPQSAIRLAPIRPLDRAFFARPPRVVARELLGKVLVRRDRNVCLAARIVEVEAYLGENDPAAHSAAGNTLRNAVLFGPPGFAYVYECFLRARGKGGMRLIPGSGTAAWS